MSTLFKFFSDAIFTREGHELALISPNAFNFKLLVLKYDDDIDVICTHINMHQVLKSLYEREKFNKIGNLKEFDIITFMKNRTVCILLSGTSGSGKSTLGSMLAQRYGIKNLLSTDFIRKTMRKMISKDENSLLHASTYETGKHLNSEEYEELLKFFKQQNKQEGKDINTFLEEMSTVKGYQYQ